MRPRIGFTLVELLVVIAIISLIIAILLPALSRAKQSANRIACAANMRQVGFALLMYAHDNGGWFPAPGERSVYRDEDWIHWQPGRKLARSQVLRYLNGSPRALRCPIEVQRPPDQYPFSYCINCELTGWSWKGNLSTWTIRPGNLKKVVQPQHKLMLIESNSEVAPDAVWQSGASGAAIIWRPLSIRHEKSREFNERTGPPGVEVPSAVGLKARGNAICVDGSYMFIDRRSTFLSYYYGPNYAGGLTPPVPLPWP